MGGRFGEAAGEGAEGAVSFFVDFVRLTKGFYFSCWVVENQIGRGTTSVSKFVSKFDSLGLGKLVHSKLKPPAPTAGSGPAVFAKRQQNKGAPATTWCMEVGVLADCGDTCFFHSISFQPQLQYPWLS